MKIAISCSGGTRRSSFLAEELDRLGLLDQFYIPFETRTNHWMARIFGWNSQRVHVSQKSIRTFPLMHFMRAVFSKLGLHFSTRYAMAKWFDHHVARLLQSPSQILWVESLIGLESIRRAKQLGMITVLDRTNSHILYQTGLLEKEYAQYGAKGTFNSPAVIERSLREYTEVDYIAVLSSFGIT